MYIIFFVFVMREIFRACAASDLGVYSFEKCEVNRCLWLALFNFEFLRDNFVFYHKLW